MPYYVVLVKLTEKGKQNLKQGWTQDRPKVKAEVQKMGGKMTGYMTFGQYDFVELLELPDDKAAARWTAMAASTGLVDTATMKAFSENEVDQMVKEMR
ncbi:MAG TPA: GYD domain-containing protein [Candidatus Acidoferrales bacterium]|nr:GYD domain-containing protein [Candidatus Acidoferrales bacterium]